MSAIEGFDKALTAKVPIPLSGEVLVLGVQVGIEHIVVALYRAGVLLNADVIISPVVRNETDTQAKRIAQLETHLRVAHEVAILFAVVRDREASQTKGAGFRYRFNDKRLIGRVLDAEIQFTPIASRLFEELKNGLHYATASDSVGSAESSMMGDSNADRITAEVF